MVEERVTDGVRIAELLASEVEGRTDGGLAELSVTNANPDVEPTTDGARAFDVTRNGAHLAAAFVHETRVSLAFGAGRDAAAETAVAVGLTVDSTPDRSASERILVESGAGVKRATDVLAAASRAAGERRPVGDESADGDGHPE